MAASTALSPPGAKGARYVRLSVMGSMYRKPPRAHRVALPRVMWLFATVVFAGSTGLAVASCHKLNEDDARAALRTAEAAATTDDAALRARMIYTGCGEAPSCADGCAKGLKLCGDKETDDEQRARILAQCFKPFAEARKAKPKTAATPWFASYFGDYLTKARDKLDPGDQARLDAAKKKLAL